MKKILLAMAFCVFSNNVWAGDKALKMAQYILRDCEEEHIKLDNKQKYNKEYARELEEVNKCLKKEIYNRSGTILSSKGETEFNGKMQDVYKNVEQLYATLIAKNNEKPIEDEIKMQNYLTNFYVYILRLVFIEMYKYDEV